MDVKALLSAHPKFIKRILRRESEDHLTLCNPEPAEMGPDQIAEWMELLKEIESQELEALERSVVHLKTQKD